MNDVILAGERIMVDLVKRVVRGNTGLDRTLMRAKVKAEVDALPPDEQACAMAYLTQRGINELRAGKYRAEFRAAVRAAEHDQGGCNEDLR